MNKKNCFTCKYETDWNRDSMGLSNTGTCKMPLPLSVLEDWRYLPYWKGAVKRGHLDNCPCWKEKYEQ